MGHQEWRIPIFWVIECYSLWFES